MKYLAPKRDITAYELAQIYLEIHLKSPQNVGLPVEFILQTSPAFMSGFGPEMQRHFKDVEEKLVDIPITSYRTPFYLRWLGRPSWRYKDLNGKWTYNPPPPKVQTHYITSQGLIPAGEPFYISD